MKKNKQLLHAALICREERDMAGYNFYIDLYLR